MFERYRPEKREGEKAEIARTSEVQEARVRVARARDISKPVRELDEFSEDTRRAWDERRLLDRPLDSKVDGETVSEAIAKAALENESGVLKNSDGSDKVVKGVAYGQFDSLHGIDLVAADAQGRPIVVEVKGVREGQADLDDEPLSSIETKDGSEIKQMDDEWVEDRWRRLISDPDRRYELWEAGIRPQYLNSMGRHVLSEKAVVVVSPKGERAVGPKLIEQCKQRSIKQISVVKV